MVIYIHGFGGSGQGSKAKLFREYFKKSIGEDFIAPSLPYVPQLAIQTLEELIASYHGEVYLIGSSLGGFYATYLSQMPQVKKVVLINPATKPMQTLSRALGSAPNFYDGSSFSWSQEHLKMLEKYEYYLPSGTWELEKFFVLLQKEDELLDYRDAEQKYKGADVIVEEGGSHSFDSIERHFENIRAFFAVGNHFKHTPKVKGVGFELDELANRVGDLYYDDMAEFLEVFSYKITLDAKADRDRGRVKLSNALDEAAKHINKSAKHIQEAWNICKIPTIQWMIKNGFNKDINIPKLNNLPSDIMEWYYKEKITMPESLIKEIKLYYEEEWDMVHTPPYNGIGTMADLDRFQMNVAIYFIDKHPKYEKEIEALISKLTK